MNIEVKRGARVKTGSCYTPELYKYTTCFNIVGKPPIEASSSLGIQSNSVGS